MNVRSVMHVALWLALFAAGTAHAEDVLRHAPDAFRAAVERVRPAIVTIETVGGTDPVEGQAPIAAGDGPTTGLVLGADGYIITSTYNFIRKPRVITVTLPDGSQHVAELLGQDLTRNLCLLKIDVPDPGNGGLTVPEYVDPNDLRVGQWAIGVGVGYGGDEPAVTAGIVSALGRIGGRAVQTDANLSPANYGGPLIDLQGRVIGICVPLTPHDQGPGAGSQWYDSGIGFAVTIQGLDHLIERLKAGDTLRRGLIGVVCSPDAVDRGVRIARVAPHSPAARADLQPGDLITAIEDRPVVTTHEVLRYLGRYAAGDTVNLTIEHEGEARQVEMALRTSPFSPR